MNYSYPFILSPRLKTFLCLESFQKSKTKQNGHCFWRGVYKNAAMWQTEQRVGGGSNIEYKRHVTLPAIAGATTKDSTDMGMIVVD